MDSYKETFETWNKVATAYQNKFMDLDLYDETYNQFCEALSLPNASILEIGCGPGNITKYLLNKRPDFKIHAIDIAENMIDLARLNNPTASFEVMDCRDINQLDTQFNGIVCGFCLPYLSETDSSKLIKDCADLLTENGVIYISFVEGDYQQSGYQSSSSGDRVYFYFHTLNNLTRQLTDHGFEITSVTNKNYERSSIKNETHSVVIARKLSVF